MKKNKKIKNTNCFLVLVLIIFSGCLATPKKNELLSVQQHRIKNLERQLKKKNKIIDQLKVKSWVGTKVPQKKTQSLTRLKQLVDGKQWISALKESSRLKDLFPNSLRLRSYRYRIFKKIGLSKQAKIEMRKVKALQAKRRRQRKMSL